MDSVLCFYLVDLIESNVEKWAEIIIFTKPLEPTSLIMELR